MSVADLFLESAARISPCGAYRYTLHRRWDAKPLLPFIMLNPSTADAEKDDPTIRRCMGFARREGAGGIVVGNLYAYRATRPDDLKRTDDPFGPENPDLLATIARTARALDMPVVCAWGASGGMFDGDRIAFDIMRREGPRLVCLGRTSSGMPRHPLYVRTDEPLRPFAIGGAAAADPGIVMQHSNIKDGGDHG